MTAEEIGAYYEYPCKPIEARIREKERTSRYVYQMVEFDLQFPTDVDPASIEQARLLAAAAPNKIRQKNLSLDYTVRFAYFRPTTPGKHPLVLVSPILGGNTIFTEDFCRYFASHGFCAALVHRKRLSLRPEDGLDKVEADLRKSVLRIRQALDWASQQPEVDASKVASFGISYGAIINTIAAGAEPRIKYHIFALGGGDLPNIIISTTEPQIRRQVSKIGGYRSWNSEQLRDALEETIRSDPLNSAPLLDPANVLMVVAQFDAVVGTQYENLLWRRIGKPRRIVVPLGHATSALALPFIKGETLQFLQERFGIPPSDNVDGTLQFYRSKQY
jgi:dienelactone hydrolase